MKSAATSSAWSSASPSSVRRGSGSSARTASHGSVVAEPLEPGGAVLEEEVGERRVVGLVPTVAGRGEARSGEKRRPIASMSWLRWTIRIGSGIASPLTCRGNPLPFQRSNVQASASRMLGPKSSLTTSMSATSQPEAKLCTAHSWAVS